MSFETKKIFSILKNYWFELFTGLIGLFMLTNSFLTETINNKTRFVEITSPITAYSFHDGVKGYKHYIFYCDRYCNEFQVKADYIDIFDKANFPTSIGTELTFIVSAKDYKRRSKCRKMFVYGITYANAKLLDLNKVIAYESKRYDLMGSMLFIGFSAIALVYKSSKIRKKHQRIRANPH